MGIGPDNIGLGTDPIALEQGLITYTCRTENWPDNMGIGPNNIGLGTDPITLEQGLIT